MKIAKGIFIPPNEVLSIYPGFNAAIENREFEYDQTYYDICDALDSNPLKEKKDIIQRIIIELEDILQGTIIRKGNRFYLQSKYGLIIESHLMAEGYRKIGLLLQLIKNGKINENTVLFWDEPEADMNPKIISKIARILRQLSEGLGIQIFVTTHDYLLSNELSLAAEYKKQPSIPMRFFTMSRTIDDEPVLIQSGEVLADLKENPILDEFSAFYSREEDEIRKHINKEVSQ